MAFRRPKTRDRDPRSTPWLGRVAGRVLSLAVRMVFGTAVIATIAAGLIYLRLSQGPIHLPVVAHILTQVFNADSDRLEADLADLVVTIGGPGEPAGVQLVDLRIRNAEGEALFAVPRLMAKFALSDLFRGHLRPTRIVLIRPEARMIRTRDGRFRFGLGDAPGVEAGDEMEGPETAQTAAISRVLDGLVGDAEPTPELSRLTEIVMYGADFSYENAATGRIWHTKRADLRVVREENGLLARLAINLADKTETGAGVVITANRRRGSGGATRVDLKFDGLRPEHLAEELDQMQWLRLFDAPLEGSLGATFHPDGRVEDLSGQMVARDGRILGIGEHGRRFDRIELAFAYEPGLERMQVSTLSVAAPALDASLSGFVDLGRDAAGAVTGLAGQFDITAMRVTVPRAFAEPLEFDGGQVAAKLRFEPLAVEALQAYLRKGDLVLGLSGTARALEQGWQTDLRAVGRNMTIAQLLQLWPVVAASKARDWAERHIHHGLIDDVVAHMRFGGGEPRLDLDFAFSGLDSSYLEEMTPIRNARGRGSLTLQDFHLEVDSGTVEAIEGAPVALDGSTFRVLDINNRPFPTDLAIRASGPTGSILALIDEEPLGLVERIGLDPASIRGQSTVVADVGFPLVGDLQLDDLEVSARARLHDLQLPFKLPGGHVADVAAAEVALVADRSALHLSGPIRLDGFPMALDWGEFYGRGKGQRRIAIEGDATPELLSLIDLDTEYFTAGRAPMKLELQQSGSDALGFAVEADLGPARLEVRDFAWTKPPGPRGRLVAEGVIGDDIRVPRFTLDTDELKASGAIEFASGGVMRRADVTRLRFRGLADVSLVAERRQLAAGREDVSLIVGGRRLDIALFDDMPEREPAGGPGGDPGAGTAGPPPIDAVIDVDELVVTPRIVSQRGTGTYRQDSAGNSEATLDGMLFGKVPFTAEYSRKSAEPAEISVLSDDAGGLLAAANLFAGARGGSLKIRAQLNPEEGVEMAGVAYMRDVQISRSGTFTSILDEGGVKEAASAAKGGGLSFDKVRVPFEYRDSVLVLGNSTAKGTMVAVTLEGTVDENNREIDLVGAISPAYALTGMLDSIPLIGDILSGGKGEGILAMTFSVGGTVDAPEFSVNPLSLLAPGFLRKLFSGRGGKVDERFLESLQRDDN